MSDNLTFTAAVDLQAAGEKQPRVQITAYNGGVIQPGGFGDTLIELSGLTHAPQIPLLADHNSSIDGIIGHGQPAVSESSLTIAGTLTKATEAASKILTLAKEGFAFEASVGVNITERTHIKAGDTVQANGRTLTAGPRGLLHVTRGVLREVSILSLGADRSTSVSIAAKGQTMSDLTTTAPADLTAERDRLKNLSAAAMQFSKDNPDHAAKVETMLTAAMDAGTSVEQFEIDLIRGCRIQHAPRPFRHHGTTSRDTLCASLMIRSGFEGLAVKAYGEQAAETARKQRINSLVDLAAQSLVLAGRHSNEFTSNDEMIRAAFSYASLPTVLSNTVGRVLIESYQETTSSWRTFCFVASADDFRQQTGIRPAAVETLEELGAAGEIKHGTLKEEATYSWKVDTFAKMISVDRKTIVNDDLGFISQISPALGTAAGRSLNDLVWSTILGNGGSFFSSDNGNLGEAGSALAVGTLGTGVKSMRSQRDSKGFDLSISPAVLVVGPTLELTARNLLSSAELFGTTAETTGLPRGNPVQGIVPNLIVEPRIENSDRFSGTSSTQWYLFGAPNTRPVTVGFLQGQQAPTIEMDQMPFDKLGVQMRVVFDYGVALSDPKAGYKATGAS